MKPRVHGVHLGWGNWIYAVTCGCGWSFNEDGVSTWEWAYGVAETHSWLYYDTNAGTCTRKERTP